MQYNLFATTAEFPKDQFNNKWAGELLIGDKQTRPEIKEAFKLDFSFSDIPDGKTVVVLGNTLMGRKALFSICACLDIVMSLEAANCVTTKEYLEYIKTKNLGEVAIAIPSYSFPEKNKTHITPKYVYIPCWAFLFKASKQDIKDPTALAAAQQNYLISENFFNQGLTEKNWVNAFKSYSLTYYDKQSNTYKVKPQIIGLS